MGLPLAVKYAHELSGFANKNSITLQWTTAIEENCQQFEIEKIKPNNRWEKIGSVQGKGSTQTENQYLAIDTNPLNGANYYRLKQIDFDGRFDYSNVATVQFCQSGIDFYPNPANRQIHFSTSAKQELQSITIYNQLGEQVLHKNGLVNRMDVSMLPTGVYILEVETVGGIALMEILVIER